MTGREHLCETHAAKLRGVLQAIDEGLRQGEAAKLIGIPAPRLAADLNWLVGKSAWPPRRAAIEALLELPVISDADYRHRRAKVNGIANADKISETLKSRAPLNARRDDGRFERFQDLIARSERRITDRMADIAAERRAHEERWLREEQAKYGLARPGRPLSSMPA